MGSVEEELKRSGVNNSEDKGREKNGLEKLSCSGQSRNLAALPIRMNEFTKEYISLKILTEIFENFHL